MKVIGHSFTVFILVAASVTPTSAQVRVSAQVDTGRDIYVGDNFRLFIVIAGSDKPGQVDLRPLQQYNPQNVENSRKSSTNIVNSKVTTTTAMIMVYSLRASEAGPIQIPSLSVVAEGKTYRTNPVAVNVVKPGTTDQLAAADVVDADIKPAEPGDETPVVGEETPVLKIKVGQGSGTLDVGTALDFVIVIAIGQRCP